MKARFIGVDSKHKTLLPSVAYHDQNMESTLRPVTPKNGFIESLQDLPWNVGVRLFTDILSYSVLTS